MARNGGRAAPELEIKLSGAPSEVAALIRTELFSDREGGWERLVSTYYDTREGLLRKAGVTLRERWEEGVRVQAMKRARAGEIARLEDEIELAADEKFPKIPQTDEFSTLLAAAGGALEPVARTIVDRYAVIVERGGARIEAAVDLGRAEGWREGKAAAAAPLAEVELELLEGEPGELMRLARRLIKDASGRLRLSVASKADQARHLAEPYKPVKSDPKLRLDSEASAREALVAALTAGAIRLADCIPAVVDYRAPEGVHQMRVALRRLRAVERMFRKAADDPGLRKLMIDAREWARLLGEARDWDVFLDETLPEALPGDYAPEGLRALRASAERARAEAWAKAGEGIASADFSLFILSLLKTAQRIAGESGGALDGGVRAFAEAALDKRLEKARRLAAGLDDASPAARHPLRIELKKLRYAAQTFRSLYGKEERKRYMSAMSRLQDGFGALNDAVVAQTLADRAALGQGRDAARAAGFLAGWRAKEAESRSAALNEDWRAFSALTPFWKED